MLKDSLNDAPNVAVSLSVNILASSGSRLEISRSTARFLDHARIYIQIANRIGLQELQVISRKARTTSSSEGF